MTKSKKVVITGLGIISPIGNTVSEYWNNCIEGKSGVDFIKRFDASNFPTKIGAEVKNFDPLNYMDKKTFQRNDIFTHFGLAAVQQALEDANLSQANLDKLDRHRVGVVIGSGIGGIHEFTKNDLAYDKSGWKKVSPFFIPALITNMASGVAAITWKLKGPNFSISTACATANHSILESMHIIRRGEADIIVSGGTEGALSPLGLAGFCASRALSANNENPQKASRPFDINRDGFVLGEGAGILVVESEESALKRNAKIYAEIAGGGMSCDAYHITAPCEDGEGVIYCMNQALINSNVEKDEVNYINTHGTSTPLGDKAEQFAIKQVFKDSIKNIKINSTKSMIGHLLGAAGGVEAIAVIKSIESNKLHPTINQDNPDPDCDLECVPNEAIDYKVSVALSNSFGFGGHNCSLIFKRYNK
ncbi:MAG: beta-ketoacyl-ACP synthase II [Spirochaetota bacterium]|nr:beta-ketoacyl-ACP synthase II [Spirochaetota bacterium]